MVDKISIISVERDARSVSRRTFSGNRKVVHRKENHVVFCAEIIRKRWGILPKDWQAKHLRWFLEVALADKSSGTRYRYYRYLREILIVINRWDDIEPFIRGSWQKP
jgi:hypothetical protein